MIVRDESGIFAKRKRWAKRASGLEISELLDLDGRSLMAWGTKSAKYK